MLEFARIPLSLLEGRHFDYTNPCWIDGGRDYHRDLKRIASKESAYRLLSHHSRVAYIATELAREAGLGNDKVLLLARASRLHDVGKTELPDILFMKAELTHSERTLTRTHVEKGVKRVWPYFPSEARILAAQHLFQKDPYPKGWKVSTGKPLLAFLQQTLALSDQVDALLTERSYKPAWSVDNTRAELLEVFGDSKAIDLAIDLRQSIME